MKIICIFADHLFAFHYDNYGDNEYDRLMELWTEVEYLKNYAKQNNINDINSFINDIAYLKSNNVFDDYSFYELLIKQL